MTGKPAMGADIQAAAPPAESLSEKEVEAMACLMIRGIEVEVSSPQFHR